MENVETRFTHLLQPIRDLAKNWDIDVAADLEAYLEEIGAISAQFEDEDHENYKPPNFTEAALVIQGSTLVYSKKVEYLYGLIFRAVDHMFEKSKKKADGKLPSSIGPDGRDMDADGLEEDFEIQPIDDILEEAAGIDLDEDIDDHTATQKSRMALRFSMALGPSAASSSGTKDGGLAIDGAEFKMNSCIMSESGALLLSGGLENNSEPLEPLFADIANPMQLLSPGLSRTMAANASVMMQQQQQQQQPEFRLGDDSDSEDERRKQAAGINLSATGSGVNVNPVTTLTTDKGTYTTVTVKKTVRGRGPAAAQKSASSMWDTLDPYDTTGIPARPFKRGRTYRKDSQIQQGIDTSAAKSKKKGNKDVDFDEDPVAGLAKSVGTNFLKPFFGEFDYLYDRMTKKRQQERRKDIESRRSVAVTVDEVVLLQDEADIVDNIDEQPQLWADPVSTAGEAAGDDMDDDDDDVGPFMPADGDNGETFDNNGNSAPQVEYQTYEDLVRSHVEKYLKEAELFQQETELSRRVADWNHRLEPMLKEQESRPPFDIQGYGGEILKTFASEKKKSKQDHPRMPFEKIVQANPLPYEVCRNFTAMLQLINNGNLEIQVQKGDDLLHQISLKLLSEDWEAITEAFSSNRGGRFEPDFQAALGDAADEGGRGSKKEKVSNRKKTKRSSKKDDIEDEMEASFEGREEASEDLELGSDEEEKPKKKVAPKKKKGKTDSKPNAATEAEEENFKTQRQLKKLDQEEEAAPAARGKAGRGRKRKGE